MLEYKELRKNKLSENKDNKKLSVINYYSHNRINTDKSSSIFDNLYERTNEDEIS
jgi:hypothetical protein